MSNTVKLLLLMAAVLLQPGCVASRAPHEPYRPPIIEPLLYQPDPDMIYTAGPDVRSWGDRKASCVGDIASSLRCAEESTGTTQMSTVYVANPLVTTADGFKSE